MTDEIEDSEFEFDADVPEDAAPSAALSSLVRTVMSLATLATAALAGLMIGWVGELILQRFGHA